MKVLLDTTYLLPIIGITVKELPRNTITKIIAKEHQVAISQISIFELVAKGAKFVKNGILKPEIVTRGIRVLAYHDQIEIIPIHSTGLLLTAFSLRNSLDDFIDCLILSTAINSCELLVTEDNDILRLQNENQFKELLKITNPAFKINTLSKAQMNLKSHEF